MGCDAGNDVNDDEANALAMGELFDDLNALKAAILEEMTLLDSTKKGITADDGPTGESGDADAAAKSATDLV